MNEPVLAAEHIYKSYFSPAENQVLKDISLEVESGEFAAIMGQSGSGKSTLLNILGCLDRPTKGALRIGGTNVHGLSDDGLADLRIRSIGFVFQSHFLLDEFTCLENAVMPILLRHGAVPKVDRDRIIGLLERVNLKGVLNRIPANMSGGEKQRCAIVRALANQPRVVLADEPTGNLDSINGREVFELFRDVNKETGAASVLVTHDDRLATQADRVLVIRDGLLSNAANPSA